MDLLLDKADQPYFTTSEKNKFLDLAISEFINFHYQKMGADEESKRAISPLISFSRFDFTASDLINGAIPYTINGQFPTLTAKYTPFGVVDIFGAIIPNSTHTPGNETDYKGHWKYGNQYVVPKRQLYVLSVNRRSYNQENTFDPLTGFQLTNFVTDVEITDYVPVKNKSIKDFYEDQYSEDPFNKTDEKANYSWAHIGNRMVFSNNSTLCDVHIEAIVIPPVERIFGSVGDGQDTWDATSAPKDKVFTDHYQRQVVEIAVERMTRVDVGLMTPPS